MDIVVYNPYLPGGIRMKHRHSKNPTTALAKLQHSLPKIDIPESVAKPIRLHVLPRYREVYSKKNIKARPVATLGGLSAIPVTWIMDMAVQDTLRKNGIDNADVWALPIEALATMGISFAMKKGVPRLVKGAEGKQNIVQYANAYRGAGYIAILGNLAVLCIRRATQSNTVTPTGYDINDLVSDVKRGKIVDMLKGVSGRALGADLLDPLVAEAKKLVDKIPKLKGLGFKIPGLSGMEADNFVKSFEGAVDTMEGDKSPNAFEGDIPSSMD